MAPQSEDIAASAVKKLSAALHDAGIAWQAVWVFGSAARDQLREDSDVDLAVLCAQPLAHARFVLMDQVGLALGRDVDLIDLRAAPAHLAWEIVTTGRVISERDELAVEQFVRFARFAAEDAEQRARMVLLAQVGHVGGSPR
jgi:predicted nucleotidyltransferase